MRDINEFFNKYKINPQNVELYEMAFTHASCNSDQKTSHHDYERLEFMGDRVLGFVIASLLFKYNPDMREGELTKAKSYLVQTEFLAKLARQEHYEDFIRIGHSLEIEDVVENKSILEDVFESVIGAMYLDKGLKFTAEFIKKIYGDEVRTFTIQEMKDYKSILQEAMQAEYRESVVYTVTQEKGPPHKRTFYVDVSFNGITLGHGEGKSKKAAEQDAARDALSKKAVI